MDYIENKKQLMMRLTENYADYKTDLLTKDRQELIDGAERIAATTNAFEYMINRHEYDDLVVAHFLKFQNPLEVVADHWIAATKETSDNPFITPAFYSDLESVEDLNLYPLVIDTQLREPLHKFMNVDVLASMQAILGQINVHYRTDFDCDKQIIHKVAQLEELEKHNLVWLCRESGTHLHQERDVFIKDTAPFNNIQFYHNDCKSEKAVIYSIEITGEKSGVVYGNLYERDRHQFAELVGRCASPHTDETLIFISGEKLRIPYKEFNYSDQQNIEYNHGKIMEVRHEAEDESVVQVALQREHERREKLPKGTISTHVQKLADQRVQTEADRIMSVFENLTEPNNPNKTHMMVQISDDFVFLASSRDTERLLEKLHDHLKNDSLYMSGLKGENGVYCFIKPQKQSIKEHLANYQKQRMLNPMKNQEIDDKSATKSKDRDVR